jgi:hypothetical protein
VADAPVEELLASADELARRWAVSLLSARPLAEMAAVPLAELAREAPALCAQIARSLRSDAELAQLLAGDARAQSGAHVASIGGDAPAAVRDVDALRDVVWQAALAALNDPSPRQVADLADRLAYVCASLLASLLAGRQPASVGVADLPVGSSAPGREKVLYSSAPVSPGGRRAVLIDERDELVASATAGASRREDAPEPPRRREFGQAPASAHAATSPRPAGESATRPRARPWDIPLDAGAASKRDSAADARSWPGSEAGAKVRITRGRSAIVDERA